MTLDLVPVVPSGYIVGVPIPYEYAVFLSYPRGGALETWVRRVLHPALVRHLHDVRGHRDAKVFLDQESIPSGARWPDQLALDHLRSRIVVAVLGGTYFESSWCTSEWMAAVEREDVIGQNALGLRPRLLIGIRYNDHYADDLGQIEDAAVRASAVARQVQADCDFSDFTQLRDAEATTDSGDRFRAAVRRLVEGPLASALGEAPKVVDAAWPRIPREAASTSRLWEARL